MKKLLSRRYDSLILWSIEWTPVDACSNHWAHFMILQKIPIYIPIYRIKRDGWRKKLSGFFCNALRQSRRLSLAWLLMQAELSCMIPHCKLRDQSFEELKINWMERILFLAVWQANFSRRCFFKFSLNFHEALREILRAKEKLNCKEKSRRMQSSCFASLTPDVDKPFCLRMALRNWIPLV